MDFYPITLLSDTALNSYDGTIRVSSRNKFFQLCLRRGQTQNMSHTENTSMDSKSPSPQALML